jgi:hypothetical protein
MIEDLAIVRGFRCLSLAIDLDPDLIDKASRIGGIFGIFVFFFLGPHRMVLF